MTPRRKVQKAKQISPPKFPPLWCCEWGLMKCPRRFYHSRSDTQSSPFHWSWSAGESWLTMPALDQDNNQKCANLDGGRRAQRRSRLIQREILSTYKAGVFSAPLFRIGEKGSLHSTCVSVFTSARRKFSDGIM